MKRSSGILMPISALPAPGGIGTLGESARRFADFLAEAGQSWWQILPVGPTSYGDSPYQSFSTYAGNPYFIDLSELCADGLLEPAEITAVTWGDRADRIDYERLYRYRFDLLGRAAGRGLARDAAAVARFESENADWLPDYALFMAIKRHFDMRSWIEWPDPGIRLRRPAAMAEYRSRLAPDIRLFTYIQFLFFRQWQVFRDYARSRGVGIIGDLPIYVAMDSADVWAAPELFQLDDRNIPTEVAGVPPDSFTADGQLWGNPLYNWAAMKQDGYAWWVRRIAGAARLYDVLRIDHFRGLESYWAVSYGETTAKRGRWVKGPGMDLMAVLNRRFPGLCFIAEDLGYLTPAVRRFLADSGLPGMKVLQFAFDGRESGNYLPHTYTPHCVCYAGTHDNTTLQGWAREADPRDIETARRYLGLNDEEGFNWGILRGGMSSVADLFIAQMQDYLNLGADARMNTPGTLSGNWQWRMLPDAITPGLTTKIANMTALYGRSLTHGGH